MATLARGKNDGSSSLNAKEHCMIRDPDLNVGLCVNTWNELSEDGTREIHGQTVLKVLDESKDVFNGDKNTSNFSLGFCWEA